MSSIDPVPMTRHVCFLTGTRADFGKLKPLILAAADVPGIRVTVLATGMHLLERYGSTVIEVRRIEPAVTVREMPNQGDDGTTMDRVLARTVQGIAGFIDGDRPDLLVVHGDRVEALAGAATGALRNVAVAHVEGGEVSGTIDGVLRHAVSKLSHLHLVSNDEAARRVVQLGEDPDTVWAIGSPDIDIMLSNTLPSIEEVCRDYEIPFDSYTLGILHGVTTDGADANARVAASLVKVLLENDGNAVIIHPNNDPGSDRILSEYDSLRENERFRIFPSVRFEAFLTLLRHAEVLVGNSSAGIREAPIYGVPSVDIGPRQRGRADHPTIIHTGTSVDEIRRGIEMALQMKRGTPSLHFGSGDSATRFRSLLCSEELWTRGIDKVFRDLAMGEV